MERSGRLGKILSLAQTSLCILWIILEFFLPTPLFWIEYKVKQHVAHRRATRGVRKSTDGVDFNLTHVAYIFNTLFSALGLVFLISMSWHTSKSVPSPWILVALTVWIIHDVLIWIWHDKQISYFYQ